MTKLLQELKLYVEMLKQRKRVEREYALKFMQDRTTLELGREYEASADALTDIIAELEAIVKRTKED
jgi:hypothetical protein